MRGSENVATLVNLLLLRGHIGREGGNFVRAIPEREKMEAA